MQAGRWKFLPSALVVMTVAVVLALSAPLTASAITIYEYEGIHFDSFIPPAGGSFTADMQISVTAVFAEDLPENLDRQAFAPSLDGPLVEFTMNDGRDDITLTHLTTDAVGSFIISTDENGEIIEWDVGINWTLDTTQYILATHFLMGAGPAEYDFGLLCTNFPNCGPSMIDRGRIDGSHGVWRVVVVPEANTGLLLGGGLVGLAANRKRLRSRH